MFRRLTQMSLAVTLGKLSLLVLIVGLPALSPSVAGAAETPKKVLFFSGSDPNLPSVILVSQILREALQKGVPGRVQFYSEALDAHRIPEDKYQQEMINLLQRKYQGEKFDLIFTLGSPGLKFLLKYNDELFPDTPKIFVNTNEHEVDGLDLGQNVTGVQGRIELRPALDLALSLHPGTRRVVVVAGNSGIDKFWEESAHKEFRSYEERLEFTYLTKTTIDELRKELAFQPQNTIVFFLNFLLDRAGNGYSIPESVSLVAPSSSPPIYVAIQSGFRPGVVGGRMISYEALGKTAAELGVRVLSGERPQDIPPQTVPSVAMFDWRELRRWGIDESRLPAGSVVLYKEPTFWEQYKWRIVGAVSLIILQTLLIAWLFLNRSRRRKAAAETERLARHAEAERRRLDEVVSNVPAVVWDTRFEADHKTRKTHFVSDYVEQMLGYSVDEWLSTPNFALTIMADEDRESASGAIETILQSGKEGALQFRWVAKDGRVLWVEAQVAAIRDETGQLVGMRGVTMDITDRKNAEEALGESEARYRNVVETQTELICRYRPDSTLTFVNDAYCRYFGKTRTELIGTKFLQFIPEPAWDLALSHVASLIKHPRAETYEHEVVLPNGERGWQQWIDHIVETNGHGSELQGIGRDVTKRRLAEELLRESEERLKQAINVARFGVFEHDHLQGILHSSPLTREIHGWGEDDTSSLDHLITQLHPEDREMFIAAVRCAHDPAGDGFFAREYRIVLDGGKVRWVSARAQTFFADKGGARHAVRTIGAELDITERKEAEEALEKAHEEVSKLKNQLQAENIYLQEEIKLAHHVDEIVGQSNAIKYVLFKIEQVGQTDSTVLILGETGTGKELVARAIHSQSLRKDRPLVQVNCAALSASLIESELFGHEKGAFTGALTRKMGRFELADGATIFLDEIGELPLDLQPKLLRVIQEGEFERLGSSRTIKVDVRIIAATNRNMTLEVEKGTFREDLWYRLNVFPITVPPLRQRKEDIPSLVEHFVSAFSKKVGKAINSISAATLKKLQDHSWPGNVRELANAIERGVINAQGPVLHIADQFSQVKPANTADMNQTLEEVEKEYITRILDQTAWRIEGPSGAAKVLGLNPSTLRTRMVKLGVQKSIRSFTANS